MMTEAELLGCVSTEAHEACCPEPRPSLPPSITVTGADERTDIFWLSKLDCEAGLLYTAMPEGRNRYPRREWLAEAVTRLPRAALHVCGRFARMQLVRRELVDLTDHVQRIQVNGALTVPECEEICAFYPKHTIITQHSRANQFLLAVKANNHAVLVDASGGRGVLPPLWRRPDTAMPVGFAGGLGPGNLAEQLHHISFVAVRPWWVDMEGRLRDDDWFACDKAQAAVEVFHSTVKAFGR